MQKRLPLIAQGAHELCGKKFHCHCFYWQCRESFFAYQAFLKIKIYGNCFLTVFWVNVLTHLNWLLVWYYSFQRSDFHQTACWRANYRVSQRKANTWKVIQESCFRRERNIHMALFFIQMAASYIHFEKAPHRPVLWGLW